MTDPQDTPEGFGPNIWLVDEMYRRYLDSPQSVSEGWREFFDDYRGDGEQRAKAPSPAPSPPLPQRGREREERGREEEERGRDLAEEAELSPLVGAPALIAEHMEASRAIPTATSVRTIPAKLLEVNRRILNNQLARREGGKVSFTHLIGWAVVRALQARPAMNSAYLERDGKPHAVRYRHINLGLAVDVTRKDGSHSLLVPNVRHAEEMDFGEFFRAYEEIIRKVRSGEITPEDFAGTTATLTNPGTVGTVQSVPRLMPGQGVIVGVGAIIYPPEYQGADPEALARMGVGRVLTLTSTYDHRVIQGAESGEFLRDVHRLLLGEEDFYDQVFASLRMPYVPARWAPDDNPPLGTPEWVEKRLRVSQLINMYRVRGHLIADLDPLQLRPPSIHPELDPRTYGLTIWDLDRTFQTLSGLGGQAELKLGEILGLLRDAYCRTTGIEYLHIQEPEQKRWIQERVERPYAEPGVEEKRAILRKLNEAEAFERFLHTKYVGHKRFGLEGAESLIPMLDAILTDAVQEGMEEAVMGMAHRGRLNVLANIVGRSYAQIFREFEGDIDPATTGGSGDVKYHVGASGTFTTPSGDELAVLVASNPSHLEAVDPVVEGMVRARQDQRPGGRDKVLPLLIHGDAAFSGQGVVSEVFNLSQLEGYQTGGTVHVVVNNQVGFTTPAEEARSSPYATDVAKAVQSPIFHVNGDDPEAVVRVARLAFAFRQAFHKDVVIDLVCYRRHGHNEADEPSYTQPLMYHAIEERRSCRKVYMERLVNAGFISVEEAERSLQEFRNLLEGAFEETRHVEARDRAPEPAPQPDARDEAQTKVSQEILARIEQALTTVPDGFTVHPKLVKILDQHRDLFGSGEVDWSLAEALALGSLVLEGARVRLAGEDSSRGTFSQRHAVLIDYESGAEWMPLAHLDPEQAPFQVVDSPLNEFAAMGFEYGYSVAAPEALVAWEAQFGDFANGGQVIIDQFVVAGEDKWGQQSGLVLLLPHGYEGQGPEHSSARMERFLIACAQDNLRLVVPSTPAQYFHVLRRQVCAAPRKPLVLFTPKSLLRARQSFSPVRELAGGRFLEVIEDPSGPEPADVQRVVLCAGKVFYDLEEGRQERDLETVALIRVEQLYPFPAERIAEVLGRYGEAEVVWAQEEPVNMGAGSFVRPRLTELVEGELRVVARPESASPASGSHRRHVEEQQRLVEEALDGG